MRQKILNVMIIAMIGWLVASCSQAINPSATSAAKTPASATCFTSYRESVSVPGEGKESLTVTMADKQKSVEYTDLEFHAILLSETGNVANDLKVWVSLPGDEQELMSVLFQFLEMPYTYAYSIEGGHGFTGLHYVYNPTSRAELQFWCEAK